jgi:hypothetical protein
MASVTSQPREPEPGRRAVSRGEGDADEDERQYLRQPQKQAPHDQHGQGLAHRGEQVFAEAVPDRAQAVVHSHGVNARAVAVNQFAPGPLDVLGELDVLSHLTLNRLVAA